MTLRISIVYHSASGHTQRLAENVAAGAGELGADVQLLNVLERDAQFWSLLSESDAIIFGTPTFMGNVSGPFKLFLDETSDFWLDLTWADKVAGGFTVGSAASGDKLLTLQTLAVFACQHGMIWVGLDELGSLQTGDGQRINDVGSWLGLMAVSSRDKSLLIEPHDQETARRFGKRIAWASRRWAGGPVH